VGQTPSKDDELDKEKTSSFEKESSNPHSEVKGFSVVDDDDDESFDYYDDDDDTDDDENDENDDDKKKHAKK
jgi:hypothetical protein